jgi:hypothetical protein
MPVHILKEVSSFLSGCERLVKGFMRYAAGALSILPAARIFRGLSGGGIFTLDIDSTEGPFWDSSQMAVEIIYCFQYFENGSVAVVDKIRLTSIPFFAIHHVAFD